MTNFTNYFSCKLLPLGDEYLGIIFNDGTSEARLMCHCSSGESFGSLINALYHMHKDVKVFDDTCAVEYALVDADDSITQNKLYTYSWIDTAPSDADFLAKRACIIWDQDTGADTFIDISKQNEKIRNSPMDIKIIVRCTEPEHYEYCVTYKNFCAAIIKAYESFVAEHGAEKYNLINASSPVDEEKLEFLKAYVWNK